MVVKPICMMMTFGMFLKIGITLYGISYVLLKYLETTFLKYMSSQDVINSFIIGKITLGSAFTSSTAVAVFLGGPFGTCSNMWSLPTIIQNYDACDASKN